MSEAATIQLRVSRHQENQEHRDVAEPLSPVRYSHTEPKQPTNVQDALECALESINKKHSDTDDKTSKDEHQQKPTVLTKEDVKYLFSGAPHFMLEKGRHNLWYPQVIFPWDFNVPSIQDLWDRQPLRHESFTLSTLHAHLPVPDNLAVGGASKSQPTDHGARRSTFDIGVFEVPNMLSLNGKEPGCVGFRHFLELPVADSVRNKPPVPKPEVDRSKLAQLPVSEAFDILQHFRDPYSACNQDTVLDRHKLICEGPPAWKRIGVREVHIKTIVERLEELGKFRADILQAGKTTTILDKESPDTLYRNLYTKFLYPPTKVSGHRDPRSLKAQIETLTKVLAVKGAWVDFSLVEWRLRVGQILWEMPPHADGDCIDPKDADDRKLMLLLEQGEERKWLLLQLLLAAELLARLDAVVRVGILRHSKDMIITAQEVQHLDKLRYGKVNWDLIFVQRFFDNLTVKYCSPSSIPPQSPSGGQARVQSKSPTSDAKASITQSLRSRIESFRHQHHTTTASTGCAWDCIIAPRRAEQQLQGLLVFADAIGWPDRDRLEKTIRSKLDAARAVLSSPIHNERPLILGKKEMYRKSPSRQLVVLHTSHKNIGSVHAGLPADQPDLGGWMSRSWLTGLVLPGEAISHFLMATILENDQKAMAKLGPVANLHGGFQYDGRSWWSVKCIVARVLSALDGTAACMGWARIDVIPRDVKTGQALENTWFEVDVKSVHPSKTKPRIHQGSKLVAESNPLGIGEVSSNTFSIPVDVPSTDKEVVKIAFRELTLSTIDTADPEHPPVKGILPVKHSSRSTLLRVSPPRVLQKSLPRKLPQLLSH
ncbi:hypothetical protein VTN77DRAFT_5989 [Rasamsonia byssochlamydoides]|uniref:uncharacterized protein n=1 Tax=Rasamsonia byssochlamydoides TaxID=89139 RepID=UPI0037432268